MHAIPEQQNKKELQRFMGMVHELCLEIHQKHVNVE